MTDGDWRDVVKAFVDRTLDEAAFHDRFFELWHAARRPVGHSSHCPEYPKAIEELFYVVEAYCPDPALRDPQSSYEADGVELRRAAELALSRLASSPR